MAKADLRFVAGRDWKEVHEAVLKGLRDESLGDFLDSRFKQIASELTMLEVLTDTYFDDEENEGLWKDGKEGKSLEKWAVRLVKAIKRGPIEWEEEGDEPASGKQ